MKTRQAHLEEEDYNNEVPASERKRARITVGNEYLPTVPPGTYPAIMAGEHLASILYDDDAERYVVVHLPSKTILCHIVLAAWAGGCMLTELDRRGVDWNVKDLASPEAQSARWAIYMMQQVVKVGKYNCVRLMIDLDAITP